LSCLVKERLRICCQLGSTERDLIFDFDTELGQLYALFLVMNDGIAVIPKIPGNIPKFLDHSGELASASSPLRGFVFSHLTYPPKIRGLDGFPLFRPVTFEEILPSDRVLGGNCIFQSGEGHS